MTINRNRSGLSRRTVLRTSATLAGVGVFGGIAGPAGASRGRGGNLVSKINSRGYYSWWEEDIAVVGMPPAAFRQSNPFDLEDEDFKAAEGGRMVSKPAAGGGVELIVEGRDWGLTGFEFHIGKIGDIESITIEAGGVGVLLGGPFIDVEGDGDYFVWEDTERTPGNTEEFLGFSTDVETFAFLGPGTSTIDEVTDLVVVVDPDEQPGLPEVTTFGELTELDPVEPDMDAYFWVGLIGGESADGILFGDGEFVITDVSVTRN